MMRLLSLFALCLLSSVTLLSAADDSFHAPDSLVLKDGSVIRGLILKNSKDEILIQEQFDENTYPKSKIVRIRDGANLDVEYTDINRHGDLPSWRVIVNDLRTNDAVKSMVEVPATIIDQGDFKNVPYKSFRINQNIELNIYGDPEDPSAVELGIYGPKSFVPKLRKTLRSFLAGFLTTKQEIAALYSLSFFGGKKAAGDLTLEITPRTSPDSYGAWWITLYNPAELNRVRLNDKEYAKLVRPMNEVFDRHDRLIQTGWSKKQLNLSEKIHQDGDEATVLLRGFYRDRNGDFRLVEDPATAPARTN